MKAPVIKNHPEYLKAKRSIKEFKPWLNKVIKKMKQDGENPVYIELQKNISESQHEELKKAIERYELLKSKKIKPDLGNVYDYGIFLIEARIYKGWTQDRLAKKIEIPKQNVKNFEGAEYDNVPSHFLVKIFKVLNIILSLKK